jgi:glycosyltransferase involved in cell wall biosynthesis
VDVLQVVDSLGPGGAERHVVDLALELHRRGHRVEVACSVSGPLAAPLAAAGVPVHALMPELVKRRACPDYAGRLAALLRRRPVDVVHAHVHASAVAAAAAVDSAAPAVDSAAPAAAVVLTEHTEAPWRTRSDRAAADRAYRRAAAVLAVSRPVAAMLLRHGVRARVVPPAITPAHVPAARRPQHWWGRPVVGRVCRLQPEKGVDVFLDAAALVRARVPDAAFPVIGAGPLAAELGRRAERLGGAAELLGHRDDARALIGAMDVMVLSSRSEGSPLVVAEALAAGVPVVAAAVGGVPDQLAGAGVLVPPDDPPALAAAVLGVLTDPARARALHVAALRRAAAWSHRAMVDAVEGAYAASRRVALRAGA